MSGGHQWRVAAATAAGASHVRNNVPNQDAVAHQLVATDRGQVVVVAVADGAGSAARSDEGSRIAADTAVADGCGRHRSTAGGGFPSQHWATSLVRRAVKRAKDAVVRYSEEQSVSSGEFASTLIVAFAGSRLLAAAQVGDGAVIAFNIGDGTARTLCAAHSGEYANETTFITSRSRPDRIAAVGHASGLDYDSLALTTDGLQNLALTMPGAGGLHGVLEPHAQRPGSDRRTRSRP